MLRVFADLGNSRLKWGRVLADGRLDVITLSTTDTVAWSSAWSRWNISGELSEWAISSVNPPVASRLRKFLDANHAVSARWYSSAADVPVQHRLDNIQTAGTDRAFAVLGAIASRASGRPSLVVSCGSAITVERITVDGIWEGGAIAPGLRLAAESLHALSTQLPLVHPEKPPNGWGRSTIPALEAGVFWGTVGVIRSLTEQLAVGLVPAPEIVWSGGDAELLMAPTANGVGETRLAPSLVLEGIRAVSGA